MSCSEGRNGPLVPQVYYLIRENNNKVCFTDWFSFFAKPRNHWLSYVAKEVTSGDLAESTSIPKMANPPRVRTCMYLKGAVT